MKPVKQVWAYFEFKNGTLSIVEQRESGILVTPLLKNHFAWDRSLGAYVFYE